MVSEDRIKEVLRRMGANTSSCGFSYLSYGISLALKDKEYLEYITKNLYLDLAHYFNTSAACVERDIRSAIEIIWRNQGELLPEVCGEKLTVKRLSNKKFLGVMYNYFIMAAEQEEGQESVLEKEE